MNRSLIIALVVVGCGMPLARTPQTRTVTADGRTIYGNLPMGPTDREALEELPAVATYRWGLPSAHFAGTSAAEDSASQTFEAHDLRVTASEVLRVNGWREARADETPQYELAVARYDRSAEWFETQPDPRAQLPDPRSCRNRPVAQRANCVEPMPRDYPPVKVLKRGTDSRIAFAIVRTSDRATAWWIAPRPIDIQRLTLELLQAGAARGTALDP